MARRRSARLGLVDQMGNLDAALAYAAKLSQAGQRQVACRYLGEKAGRVHRISGGLETRAVMRSSAAAETAYDFPGFVAARQQVAG